ncbi:MAG: hypothetical protein AB8E15_07295 [Bdellovibrionales bacterium]
MNFKLIMSTVISMSVLIACSNSDDTSAPTPKGDRSAKREAPNQSPPKPAPGLEDAQTQMEDKNGDGHQLVLKLLPQTKIKLRDVDLETIDVKAYNPAAGTEVDLLVGLDAFDDDQKFNDSMKQLKYVITAKKEMKLIIETDNSGRAHEYLLDPGTTVGVAQDDFLIDVALPLNEFGEPVSVIEEIASQDSSVRNKNITALNQQLDDYSKMAESERTAIAKTEASRAANITDEIFGDIQVPLKTQTSAAQKADAPIRNIQIPMNVNVPDQLSINNFDRIECDEKDAEQMMEQIIRTNDLDNPNLQLAARCIAVNHPQIFVDTLNSEVQSTTTKTTYIKWTRSVSLSVKSRNIIDVPVAVSREIISKPSIDPLTYVDLAETARYYYLAYFKPSDVRKREVRKDMESIERLGRLLTKLDMDQKVVRTALGEVLAILIKYDFQNETVELMEKIVTTDMERMSVTIDSSKKRKKRLPLNLSKALKVASDAKDIDGDSYQMNEETMEDFLDQRSIKNFDRYLRPTFIVKRR